MATSIPDLEGRSSDGFGGRARGTVAQLGRFTARNPMVVVLVVLVVTASFVYDGFLEPANLKNLLAQNAPLALVAAGMTFVIIAGGFDLSVGAILAVAAVLYTSLDGTVGVGVAILAAIVAGAVAGIANGIIVTRLRVNPFVATLGSASVFAGAAALYAGDNALQISSSSFNTLGTAELIGLPVSVWLAIVAFVLLGVLLARTTFGRSVYAIGGNEDAARLTGIRVGPVRATTFALVGLLAGLAGVVLASQVGGGQPTFGASLALDAIAVVIIGGTALAGGEGAIWRTAIGLLVLATVNNLFQSLALDASIQQMLKGMIVLVAVTLDALVRTRRSA